MKTGLIIPICTTHDMQAESLENARRFSRSDTPVYALDNGFLPPLPDGIEPLSSGTVFTDEADLWYWMMEFGLAQGWDWVAVHHDDFALLEGGWEDRLQRADGWRTPIASWCTYSGWSKDGNSFGLGPRLIGATFDPMGWAFRPRQLMDERGCISQMYHGFGYGSWDLMGWLLEHDYACWSIPLNSKHQWGPQNRNSRHLMMAGAPGHQEVVARYAGVLPAAAINDHSVDINGRIVRIAPPGWVKHEPRWDRHGSTRFVANDERRGEREFITLNACRIDILHLSELAAYYGTDKGPFFGGDASCGGHGYTEAYNEILEPRRRSVTSVLEIGAYEGASLQMWRDYFPNATIHGVDNLLEVSRQKLDAIAADGRVVMHYGQQQDPDLLAEVSESCDGFDLIVDDGSHNANDIIASFDALWPKCRWVYIVEDLASGQALQSVIDRARREASMLRLEAIPSRHAGVFSLVIYRGEPN